MRAELLNCPYCIPWKGEHGKKPPKGVGLFKIKKVGDIVHVYQCQRCKGVFRHIVISTPLLWDNLNTYEKKAFKLDKWVKRRLEQWKKSKK